MISIRSSPFTGSEPHKPSKLEEKYDEFPFCGKCKDEIRKLYKIHTEMTNMSQKFERARDTVAKTMINTFVEQRILVVGPESDEKKLSLRKSNIARLLKSKFSMFVIKSNIQFKYRPSTNSIVLV
jgi:hypothetical protein